MLMAQAVLKLIIPFSAILLAFLYYHSSPTSSCPIREPSTPPCEDYRLKAPANPHVASWKTWFHPSQSLAVNLTASPSRDWNLFRHLGGLGPWIEHGPSRTGNRDEEEQAASIAPPDGCAIDQVHMLSRHAERFPTPSVGDRHLKSLERIRALGVPLNNSLAFLNDWAYFTDNPSRDFGQLTRTGPYAGTLSAFTSGVRFGTRYSKLIPNDATLRFWASDSQRVIDSARYFASGLFGLDWEASRKAELQVIPETFERGADTLTPGDTCREYLDSEQGHDLGAAMLARFQETYTPGIAERLVKDNPALGALEAWEVYGMQEMCGFEIMVRGLSPWCDLFSQQEWHSFEYARDLLLYYRAGPGNAYSATLGWLYLNATASLLSAGPDAGTLFLSFMHDGDMAPFLAALGLHADPDDGLSLPAEQIAEWRTWKTSSVLPMGARIILERMSCFSEDDKDGVYIRININDHIVPLPFCQDGPGRSCSLTSFEEYVIRRGHETRPFGEVCGLGDHPERITFLHQSTFPG